MDALPLSPWPTGKPASPAMCGDSERVSVLSAYGLDALEDDPELAEITRFAASLCAAPMAMVSLVEKERQRFLTRTGIEDRETPRPVSFCAHAMLEAEPMVVPDARLDPRFETNPLVTGHPHIRFYAGSPLISHEGAPLGSLCVIDTEARPGGLTEIQRDGLQVLAAAVMRRLRHQREYLEKRAELLRGERNLRALADSIPDIAWSSDAQGNFDYYNARWHEFTGVAGPVLAEDWEPLLDHEDFAKTLELWQKKFERGEPFEAEYRLRSRTGDFRWMIARAMPVKDAAGRVERWFGTVTDIDDARRRHDERALLAQELSHRIKNIFAVIGGLVLLKGRDHPEAQAFVGEIGDTLQSLARAHNYVTQDQSGNDDTLHGLLRKLLAPYGDQGGARLSLTGEDVPVRSSSATPMALVFHELATNSAKYGAFSAADGNVAIETTVEGETVRIIWRETGGPPPQEAIGSGFGSRLIEKTVRGQLSGTLVRNFESDGMVAELTLARSTL